MIDAHVIDFEDWKAHPVLPILVSDCGRLISTITGNHLNPSKRYDGYLIIRLYLGPDNLVTKRVHRLVLETFVGDCPDEMTARHKNGISDDNRLKNLAWGTDQEQHQDKLRHGTQIDPPILKGSKNHRWKYNRMIIDWVLCVTEKGLSQRAIAKITGVSKTQIARIQKGRRSDVKK